MPKTISGDLATLIGREVTTLCTLWKVNRLDGNSFYFTDHDVDISFEENTYLSAVGYSRSAISNSSDLSVSNVDVTGFFDSETITDPDLDAGLYDFATVTVYIVDWANLSAGALVLRKGTFGEVTTGDSGVFTTQLRGLTQAYSMNLLDYYQPICRTTVGSKLCKIPIKPPLILRSTVYAKSNGIVQVRDNADGTTTPTIVRVADGDPGLPENYHNVIFDCTTAGTTASMAPTYDFTVGHTTTDGSAVFTAREAWTRSAVVASVTDRRIFSITVTEARDVDGWFKEGVVTWFTGNNAGRSMEVKNWTQSGTMVELFLDMGFDIQVGDKISINAGCDLSRPTCQNKFNNMLNRRAEDDIPGWHVLLDYPDR